MSRPHSHEHSDKSKLVSSSGQELLIFSIVTIKMQNTWLGSKTCLSPLDFFALNSLFVQYFSIVLFSISKKTRGKETSAVAWFGSNLMDFYCARLVYSARVL